MSSLPMQIDSCIAPSTASMSSPSPAATAGWRPTRWSDLPTDWLGCISAFLRLRDLSSSVLPICRSWRAGLHAAPLRHEKWLLSGEQLAKLGGASIDIRRHVAKLSTRDDLSQKSLALTHRLPSLTYLKCCIDCSDDEDDDDEEEEEEETAGMMQQQRRFEFPPRLTALHLTLTTAEDDDPMWSQLECVIDAVSHVTTLTSLFITLPEEEVQQFAHVPLRVLQPLARLRESLTELSVFRDVSRDFIGAGFSRGHVDLLRSLHRLESISLCGIVDWTMQALKWIADEPSLTHLRVMDLGTTPITAGHAAVLARFTWLRHISFRLSDRDSSFLGNLTQLISIAVTCASWEDPVLLVSALSHCTHIEKMRLIHPTLTSEHICALLSSLPHLSELDLIMSEEITSLSFASSIGHLALTLESLVLFRCAALAPEEVRHLRALTALRELFVKESFNRPLDDDTIASMMPSSPRFARDVWPHLSRFVYTPPE